MTDNTKSSGALSYVRNFFASLDGIVYFILNLIFELFFNLSNASIHNEDIINGFFNRIQLIIGIYIVFKLSFSIINGIINPDQAMDSKKGASGIILRIITSLVMLSLIIPLSGIPDSEPAGSLNADIRDTGVLFGTLQNLQSRILNGNIIGKLIIGIPDSKKTDENFLSESQQVVASITKGFVSINMKPDGENWMCGGPVDESDTQIQIFNMSSSKYSDILDLVTIKCDEGSKYKFSYMFIFSSILGIAFIIIVAGFCVDVAVRLIKLLILRVIAPIPIISYIDPKSEKDGAFGAWVKTLTSTYLDLFLRLIVIYFIVFIAFLMIDTFNSNNIGFTSNNTFINQLSLIAIWIGLFVFAKQSPQFFKTMLGIKSDTKGFFSGVGSIIGAGAIAGAVGANAAMSGKNAYLRGKMHNDATIQENETAGQRTKRIMGNVGAGLIGGISSNVSGTKAALKAKNNRIGAATNARNDKINAYSDKLANPNNNYSSNLGAIIGRVSDKAKEDSALNVNGADINSGASKIFGSKYSFTGNNLNSARFESLRASASAQGLDKFSFGGQDVSMDDAALLSDVVKKNSESAYFSQRQSGPDADGNLINLVNNANKSGKYVAGKPQLSSSSSFGKDVKAKAGQYGNVGSNVKRNLYNARKSK